MPSKDELRILQALDLETKIMKTKQRIREWINYYGTDGVYVSFSGGKDSTVLLHIVRQMYPDIEAVFVDTGLEYPEIRSFVKSFDNVTILRPKMRFDEVIRQYGYPFIGKKQADTIHGARNSLRKGVYSLRLMEMGISIEEATEIGLKLPSEEMLNRYTAACKNSKYVMPKYKPLLFEIDFDISPYCCNIMKKSPMYVFQKQNHKVPITAQMAEESMLREAAWLKYGCNAFEAKHKISNPMGFWTEQDVLLYIKRYGLTIASVYGDIVYKTRFGLIYEDCLCDTDCKLCTTACDRTGCVYCSFGAQEEKGESRFERLKKTHPRQYEYCMGGGAYDTDGLWKPTKEGLGMAHCIDELNKIYGPNFIRY
ncbi:MAG: phosphoadenosine phosphosulfate reductase family protein [Clostridia bacterium]|nr:phosphoadenosine phosphosulfate reductase family protein [Clostridia bacterium]